jgi:hypothetical protein
VTGGDSNSPVKSSRIEHEASKIVAISQDNKKPDLSDKTENKKIVVIKKKLPDSSIDDIPAISPTVTDGPKKKSISKRKSAEAKVNKTTAIQKSRSTYVPEPVAAPPPDFISITVKKHNTAPKERDSGSKKKVVVVKKETPLFLPVVESFPTPVISFGHTPEDHLSAPMDSNSFISNIKDINPFGQPIDLYPPSLPPDFVPIRKKEVKGDEPLVVIKRKEPKPLSEKKRVPKEHKILEDGEIPQQSKKRKSKFDLEGNENGSQESTKKKSKSKSSVIAEGFVLPVDGVPGDGKSDESGSLLKIKAKKLLPIKTDDLGHSDGHTTDNTPNTPIEELAQKYQIDINYVQDFEKDFCPEWFKEGKGKISVKTPERYTRIRNEIISLWHESKPNYVSKLKIKACLGNETDLTAIFRIHSFLEAIGTINRDAKGKRGRKPRKFQVVTLPDATIAVPGRPKHKLEKKHTVTGPNGEPIDELAGITIVHDDDGQETHPIDPFTMIAPLRYNESNPAPFAVGIESNVLLVVDFHSHLVQTEVIGLLGGNFDADSLRLEVVDVFPCKSTGTGIQVSIFDAV